jgi:hypothetical protein
VPALIVFIFRHLPLYTYFVREPPQSRSAYVSMMSAPAEVSVHAKSAPRPMSM